MPDHINFIKKREFERVAQEEIVLELDKRDVLDKVQTYENCYFRLFWIRKI